MYISNVSIKKILEEVKDLSIKKDQVAMILLSEDAGIDIDDLVKALNTLGILFFGAFFPGIIANNKQVNDGAIIKVLPMRTKPCILKHGEQQDFEIPIDLSANSEGEKSGAIVLVDGLSPHISSFLSTIFNVLGNSVNYIGGGGGSLSFEQGPCLFSNEGTFQDAAIVMIVDNKISTGVRHGWKKIGGPYIATKTNKNTILEINWQNAYDVYKEIVEEDSRYKISPENFYTISNCYPFGIKKNGSEYIVREPISVNAEGEILCLADVRENVVLDILKGQTNNLIEAAHEAVEIATEESDFSECLVIDCISRAIFLEDDYSKSLDIIDEHILEQNKNVPVEGILSLGEISASGNGYLEIFNKTIVVGLI